MKADEFEMETCYKIWNNKTGDCTQVGPDSDGLGLVEILQKYGSGAQIARLVLTIDEATLLCEALRRAVDDMQKVKA